MEAFIESLVTQLSLPVLFIIIAFSLYTLSKGADLLVNQSVALSKQFGIPKMVIGATIVSLGTTLPETSVSVMAAISGNADLALGNAVGSIICDTGLILGIATIISPLPIQREIVNRHGWIQFGAGMLLVLLSIPYFSLTDFSNTVGYISKLEGFLLVILLIGYIFMSIKWTRNTNDEFAAASEEEVGDGNKLVIFVKLIIGIAVVIISSKILIPTVQETALRLNIPNSVIAATLVAFGTSLPELVTSVTAVIKGHGELAMGNVIGADILNVLFVTGASAAFGNAINVTPNFFTLYFPAMLFVLAVFRIGTLYYKDYLKRPFGFILLGTYILISIFSYI